MVQFKQKESVEKIKNSILTDNFNSIKWSIKSKINDYVFTDSFFILLKSFTIFKG